MTADRYDFVIIGGGSAGSLLANRLSADGTNRVLVLEAGRRDAWWDVLIHMPAALAFPIGNRWYDWKFESEPEPYLGNRRIYHARGKVLGGSSSINGMIFQRGNPADFERWADAPGMEHWDFAHCLPYFKQIETSDQGDDDTYRGHSGPLVLTRGAATNPLFQAFLHAAQQAGYTSTEDVNGYRQEGFAAFDANRHRGRRLSAARAFLHPVAERPNLAVITRATATKLIIDGSRVTGVEYQRTRRRQSVIANHVVLCGGAFNSPQLLQLSGIGNAYELERLGIDVVADLPGVGENLQDHLEVYIQYSSKRPVTMQPYLALWRRPFIGLQWLFRRGVGTSNQFEAGGFVRSNSEVAWPNLMLHFLPLAVRYDGSVPVGGHGYQVHIGPMYSDAVGSVKITSTNPFEKPALRFNYLSTDQDRREWVEAVRCARTILEQPAFDEYNGGEISPGPNVATDEEILAWVARDAETALHPSGTAKMGLDDRAVVHPDTMGVHDVDGLSIADASVIPRITNANIYAPVMMVAEKAADLILGNSPLPPEHVEWYQHQADT